MYLIFLSLAALAAVDPSPLLAAVSCQQVLLGSSKTSIENLIEKLERPYLSPESHAALDRINSADSYGISLPDIMIAKLGELNRQVYPTNHTVAVSGPEQTRVRQGALIATLETLDQIPTYARLPSEARMQIAVTILDGGRELMHLRLQSMRHLIRFLISQADINSSTQLKTDLVTVARASQAADQRNNTLHWLRVASASKFASVASFEQARSLARSTLKALEIEEGKSKEAVRNPINDLRAAKLLESLQPSKAFPEDLKKSLETAFKKSGSPDWEVQYKIAELRKSILKQILLDSEFYKSLTIEEQTTLRESDHALNNINGVLADRIETRIGDILESRHKDKVRRLELEMRMLEGIQQAFLDQHPR